MKKITFLNSLLLFSPILVNTNIQNNSKKIHIQNNTNGNEVMGDITVTVDGTTITGYVSGEGMLKVNSNITAIGDLAFYNTPNLISLDLSQATSLTSIGINSFAGCSNLSGDIVMPNSLNNIGQQAFNPTQISEIAFSSTQVPSFGQNWYGSTLSKIYVPNNSKNNYTSALNFGFEASNVDEWSYDSAQATIAGDFSQIEIKPTESGSTTNKFTYSGFSPETITKFTNWSLVPIKQTTQIPEGLSISDGIISWNQVPEGIYTFQIKGSNLGNEKTSTEQINIISLSQSFQVQGNTNINTSKSQSGSEKYSINNQLLNPDQWEIIMNEGETPNWLSISEQGLLSWTDQCIEGTYKFKLKATNSSTSIYVDSETITLNVNSQQKHNNLNLILGLSLGIAAIVLSLISLGTWFIIRRRKQ